MVSKIGSSFKDKAFLLRAVDYGDEHRILSCLTTEHGRIDLIALAAKKSRNRFAGVLDFLNLLDIEFQSPGRGNLNRLLHCELRKSYSVPRLDYERTVLALEWLRILSKAVPVGSRVPDLFPLLQYCLEHLAARHPFQVDLVFKKRLLSCLGYHLELGHCRRCGTEDSAEFHFSSHQGGLLCRRCRESASGRRISSPFPNSAWSLDEAASPWQMEAMEEARLILDDSFRDFLDIIPNS
jgi:DNA repair protein RecO (recombination protein O)